MDPEKVFKYVRETTIYGQFKLWHLILFMVLGPMLTWPMLAVLLVVFTSEVTKTVKDFTGSITSNGGSYQGASVRDQVATQGSAPGPDAPGGSNR